MLMAQLQARGAELHETASQLQAAQAAIADKNTAIEDLLQQKAEVCASWQPACWCSVPMHTALDSANSSYRPQVLVMTGRLTL